MPPKAVRFKTLARRSSISLSRGAEHYKRYRDEMSAQNDNVLIAQSRNVLLTGSGWGGGTRYTSHDPTGPRSADRSEESQEGADHPASSCRRDWTNRAA